MANAAVDVFAAQLQDGDFGVKKRTAGQQPCSAKDAHHHSPHCPTVMTEEVARQLRAKAAELHAPVEVRQLSITKGKGVFATTTATCGSILWRETPVVAPLQHLTNRGIGAICHCCCRWLGSFSDMASSVLANLEESEESDESSSESEDGKPPPMQPRQREQFVQCVGQCGAVYCSGKCRDTVWDLQHKLLCTGCGGLDPEELSEGHAIHRGALLRFEHHAAACNEMLLLAARVIATILCAWERDGCTDEALVQAKALFGTFHNPAWWDVSALRHTSSAESAAERAHMEQELRRSLRLLELALLPCHRGACSELFELEFYARIVGMFECNNVSVEIDCPLTFLLSGQRLNAEAELAALGPSLRAKLESAAPSLYEHGFKGTGLFTLISMLNHSCSPNCCIDYDSDAIAQVKLLRDVVEGEELCISYIDEDSDYADRQQQLCEYGFECDCERCTKCRSKMSAPPC